MNNLLKLTLAFLKRSELDEEILKQISSVKSFAERIRICNEHFQKIGTGSSRIAFLMPNDLVLKLAKNPKGIAQNRIENDGFLTNNWIVNSPVKADDNDLWTISIRAVKAKPSDFKELGFTFEEFKYAIANLCQKMGWSNYAQPTPNTMNPERLKEIQDKDFFHELTNVMGNMGLLFGDIIKISSWGKVDGQLMLIDFGITEDLYNSLYR